MEKIYIILVEDQREVLHTILSHLHDFEQWIVVEECESAAEAKALMGEIDNEGNFVAVIISDHAMPVQTGVDFLSEMNQDSRFPNTKKILLTGQATHTDTIQAINKAEINNYIEKPWKQNDLVEAVSILLTEYIIQRGIPYESYMPILNKPRLFELLKEHL